MNDSEEVVMYAPLSLSSLPEEMARDLRKNAMETWVTSGSDKAGRHSHRHRHHHSRSNEVPLNGSGQISLPILPEEGLLPSYSLDTAAKV